MKVRHFQAKLLLAALLPSILLALLLSYLWLTWSQRSLETAQRQRLDALSGQLAAAAEFHLFTGDRQALQALTSATLQRDADLVGVAILDVKGNLLARSGGADAKLDSLPLWPAKDDAYRSRLVRPIQQTPLLLEDPFTTVADRAPEGHSILVVGHVVLEVSQAGLYRERNRQLLLGVAMILAALACAALLAIYMAKGVTQPIARIMRVVERIGRGDLNARVEPDPDCVLFQLEIGINRMAEKVGLSQGELQARIDAATDELLAQKELAELQARIDPLTGLHNRRAFMEHVERELHRADRYGARLCLIMLDLDFFKDVNDTYGHDVGDRLLVAIAGLLRQSIREVDFAARLGGEEFIVLMPETDIEAARVVAERMRQAIASLRLARDEHEVGCTASFGIAECTGGDTDIAALLIAADRALYAAKAAGRDQVRAVGDEVTAGPEDGRPRNDRSDPVHDET
jgi:diguanylate cyclase (GGDEF)-like protein